MMLFEEPADTAWGKKFCGLVDMLEDRKGREPMSAGQKMGRCETGG